MGKKYTDEELKTAVKNNKSLAGVLRDLNIKVAGGNYDTIKNKIALLELNTDHFTGKVWSKGQSLKDWKEYKKSSSRKRVLLVERGHCCESCNLTEWMGVPIMLELHHKDGNKLNNDKDNLQLLCCNCHANTTNWRFRNR